MNPSDRKIEAFTKTVVAVAVFLAGVTGFPPIAKAQSLGAFTSSGNISQPRTGHTATLLPNGKVLVTGGDENVSANNECRTNVTTLFGVELFDPSIGIFTPAGNLRRSRFGHTATLLANCKVLIVGGDKENFDFLTECEGNFLAPLPSAELYDLSTATFRRTGSMTQIRTGHTATRLRDGRVLIAGGATNGTVSAEIYHPDTGSFSPAGNMNSSRSFQTASELSDDRVLMAGGYAGSYTTNTSEIYDSYLPRVLGTHSKAVRDFNFDGKSDLLWRDWSGNVSMWLMNGTTIATNSLIANIWPGWSIAGVGDFNGDGKSDILWRDIAENLAIWMMDGTNVTL